MGTQGKKRTLIDRLALLLLAVFLVALGFWAASHYLPGRVFYRHYESLAVGQTEAQVQEIFGREPDYSYAYRNARILHYFRNGLFPGNLPVRINDEPMLSTVDGETVHTPPRELPTRFDAHTDIPYVYASAQIMIGKDGLVKAFTCNGEADVVHTVDGGVPGSHLSDLEESFFD